ncbi:DUF4442 domain-containing protein [Rubrobacter indicoceani]|uniref:DUF4442 domain-containing protein n=1 Tax=Rubrobacter indicoceani TaxID=2051957 RepID=UPI000E5ACDED|nr:DUF4442 domain-containing protein [Rubrobacter indicoceani]
MGTTAGRKESWTTWFYRLAVNVYPSYRGSGGRVKYIAPDWLEVRMELPLSWRTKNSAGTIFGGSLYSAIDPFFALMVAKNLGREYVVWDKAAKIRYRRPGDAKLYARFVLDRSEIEGIRREMEHRRSTDRVYTVELVDGLGDVKTRIEKTIYVGWRDMRRSDAEKRRGFVHEKEAG